MKVSVRNILLMVLMVAASGLAIALKPTKKMFEERASIELDSLIPKSFGGWRQDIASSVQIVDPQQQQTIDRIYNQTFSKTFIGADGYRIMVSIAYGKDQSDATQLHYPEVCYPAQGFELKGIETAVISTSIADIPVKKVVTELGTQRVEPVTYWVMIGDYAIVGGWRKKIAEMRYGLRGEVPDGLLFRVSSIDHEPAKAFARQEQFVADLVLAVAPENRARLFGLSGAHSANR